jgi:hypothetical protein
MPMNLERELRSERPISGSEFAFKGLTGSLREEQTMQTVHPRYTLAERLVLAVVTMITWPVEHFLGWVRRKVVVDLVPTADRR